MSNEALFQELVEATRRLAEQAAHPRTRTLSVSPEVARLLEGIGAPQAPPAHEAESPAAASQRESVAASLAELAAEVSACTKCSLCETRKQTVFSDGDARSGIVFVGEAPGADEDAQGVPFVGKAGQLLTRIIENGMKIPRESVYICNVLKCRPPGNRDPLASEKAACEPYLVRQLEWIRPKVIVALGRHAANTLLKRDDSTAALRGQWHFYQDIPLRVTYHPAYLLRCEDDPARSRSERAKVWADIQEVMKVASGELRLDGTGAPANQPGLFE